MADKDQGNELRNSILKMRYGDTKPTDPSRVYSDIASIAAAHRCNRRLVEATLLATDLSLMTDKQRKFVDHTIAEKQICNVDRQ